MEEALSSRGALITMTSKHVKLDNLTLNRISIKLLNELSNKSPEVISESGIGINIIQEYMKRGVGELALLMRYGQPFISINFDEQAYLDTIATVKPDYVNNLINAGSEFGVVNYFYPMISKRRFSYLLGVSFTNPRKTGRPRIVKDEELNKNILKAFDLAHAEKKTMIDVLLHLNEKFGKFKDVNINYLFKFLMKRRPIQVDQLEIL